MNSCNSATYVTGSGGVLPSGSADNLRFEIYNVDEDRGTFTLAIRRGNDDDKDKDILEEFRSLSLDPNSTNYIAARIGDQYTTAKVADADDVYLDTVGSYTNKSRYIRVDKVLNPTPNYTIADKGKLPLEQGGAFYGATGLPGICYKADGSEETSKTALYFEDMTTEKTDYNQGVLPSDYNTAIDLLANADEYQINLISAPGLLNADTIGSLIGLAEGRGDCLAIVDIQPYGASVADVTNAASGFNSSYGTTYWPWLQLYSSTGKQEWCPASTVIPGMYVWSDKQTAPWYAPAGMTRGGISAIQAARKLTKAQRDALYVKSVNPIATMPGAGLVAYGQKTLQKKASALDRVNVRRLLIEVKNTVRNMASGLLFEQNTEALRNAFRAQLDPYLSGIVKRNGLVGYSIDLSGNTSEAIDRNEFHCSVTLAPTRSIEYIYLTFTVTATGVSFD